MTDVADRGNRPVSNRLHRRVYTAMIALAAVLIVSVWGFAGPGYSDVVVVVVSGFVIVTVGLQAALWRTGGRRRDPNRERKSFRDWADSEFDTWQGRLTAKSAAVEILLPLAAVAFGMAIFAIVLHFTIPGGGA
jgi:hypothetical protein